MARRYWLFKNEPDCFSIDDLKKAPDKTTPWEGVRNYQARNMLRDDIRKGDEVFFYHSNADPTGIVGVCTVVRSGYPDPTALDPESQYFDPKSSEDEPRWYMVDVKLKRKFKDTIPLSKLKQTLGLENMMLTQRGSRLSIQPVKPDEWRIIMDLAREL